jgi:hypothetical protein
MDDRWRTPSDGKRVNKHCHHRQFLFLISWFLKKSSVKRKITLAINCYKRYLLLLSPLEINLCKIKLWKLNRRQMPSDGKNVKSVQGLDTKCWQYLIRSFVSGDLKKKENKLEAQRAEPVSLTFHSASRKRNTEIDQLGICRRLSFHNLIFPLAKWTET